MSLNFCWGQYCSSDDEEVIEKGVQNVKRILADNFVRPDEAQKILSLLRSRGSYTIIDKVTVQLNIKKDRYEAEFSNLGLKEIPIEDEYPERYDRLLCGGIWCIVQLSYESEDESFVDTGLVEKSKKKQSESPIQIMKLTPIQMPHVDIHELKDGRKAFSQEEWMDVMLRSIGMEPDTLNIREKWLLLARMLPLVENNFNLCELGPPQHWQESSVQGDLTEQHPGIRRPNNSGKPVLQHGPQDGRPRWFVGLRCL